MNSNASDASQRRSPSLVQSDPPVVGTTEEERTDVESSVYLPNPNGPPWHSTLALKLCRDKRLGDIPGWFDRWDVFLGVNDLATSITHVECDAHQASLRRGLWLRVVAHSALVVGLLTVGVCVPAVSLFLHNTFSSAWHRVLLYVALVLDLVLLKLALDLSVLRRLLFLVYSVTLVLLLASVEIVSSSQKAILYGCGLALLPLVLVWLLCGIQRHTNDHTVVFLSHVPIGSIAAAVTSLVTVAIHFGSPAPGLFDDDDHLALVVLALVAVALLVPYEASLLYRTLAPEETWLGVYCAHLDLLVVTLVTPTVLVLMVLGGILGLAIGTPVEMLHQLYSSAWALYSGGSPFGIVWHLQCWRRRSRVGATVPQDQPTERS